ncbi:hypothetical protein H6P81_019207 [Aristolochia fimbriata]|uniref:Uncharacterized protein n=1 Tax=Aristolochia fimbriata TaxID=158543 RepID=A0AAV7DR66_ARIFI|nr:hypothetical protein H6P81_019207 [Aristolochia fimbriata]
MKRAHEANKREEDRVVQFNAQGKVSDTLCIGHALKEEMVSRGFVDATDYELVTVEDHPQQKTGYDCGIFMVNLLHSQIVLSSPLKIQATHRITCLNLRIDMGEAADGASRKTVFVTVGTTCFDSLVRGVDTHSVKEELSRKGYTDLLIQMGRGSYIPSKTSGEGDLAVDYFTFSSSIADYLKFASLIISHAGSGSIFETLRLGKPLIVVVNEDLMDNHQSELAEELAERRHLLCARPQNLHETIRTMDLESLIPYPPADATPVAKCINRFLGFPDD